jgi:peptidoglycan hydrolase CwlO-like protein
MKFDPITEYILEKDRKIKEGEIITEMNPFDQLVMIGQVPGFAVGIWTATAIAAAWEVYTDYISKAGRACRRYSTSSTHRKLCEEEYKKNGIEKKIDVLKKAINKCSKSAEPGMCKAKLNKKISSDKLKLRKKESKIKELKEKVKNEKRFSN